jgi:hypothetical protein
MVVKVQTQTKGFRLQKRTAKLVFSGDYDGAEVVVRLDVPVGVFINIQDLVANSEQLQVFNVFGDKVLTEWNLQDDDGQDIPATAEGMQEIPLSLANLMIEQWVEVTTQPSTPLG